ncbi:receptor-type tyrosine-protein phosphatase eta [Eublepharis macularius]|uniref:Receptor-type tyrosine-protein phosphatase eta n=1 Tax=Eublepharis macularius TaxID=481883 RepID=A0AA97KRZ2_EUBMA|nr:receptor-type tyrosine-protein phosphatase eta [Eublepharis macularius]
MRQLALLSLLLVLCLSKIKVLAACDECSSVNITAKNTEIYIEKPDNFTISNVTFANGMLAKHELLNNSVSELEAGVQYIVYLQNITEICCKNITTVPNAVTDIRFSSITTTSVNVVWNSTDRNAADYSYRIEVVGNGTNRTENSNVTSAVIMNLEPGTLYTFTIFPQVAGIKGDPRNASTYTMPNAVTDIRFSSITTTSVNVVWNSTDRNAADYSYRIEVVGNGTNRTENSNVTSAVIMNLEPGTLYTFTIFPQVAGIKGDPRNASTYTMPNAVTDIRFSSITTTSVNVVWNSTDRNAADYSYRIEVVGNGTNRTENSNVTSAVIMNLEPGTLYTFTIFPQVAEIEGDPRNTSTYTMPSAVTGIHFSSITTTSVDLKWNNSDRNAADYSYRIEVVGNGTNRTEILDVTSAVIMNLEPGTLFTFTIFPQVARIEGDPRNTSTYTVPNAVTDIRFSSITTTSVNVVWNSTDRTAADYSYRIEVVGNGTNRTENSNVTSAVIMNLEPGTLYTFTIFPQVAGIEGDSRNASTYTMPNAVTDIRFSSITTTSVNVMWNSTDRNAADYSYRIEVVGNGTNRTENSNVTSAVIMNLEPGTLYTFTIFPQVAGIEGDQKNRSTYTKPSAVSNITVKNITTTEIILNWSIEDAAASGYAYRIYIQNVNTTGENFTQSSSSQTASIPNLKPGTAYTFSIFAQVVSSKTEGDSNSLSVCTVAAPVDKLDCTPVPKQPELNLFWNLPDGIYNGFRIQISNGTSNRTEHYSPENQAAIIKDLSYFVNYTVRVVTLSCGEMGFAPEKVCLTSITDPPVPSERPTVEATSHNSLKVQFNPFDSINGPLTAYAVIISTSKEMKCSNESLTVTYQDFIKKKTDSYVAYVKDVQPSSKVDHYAIEIGDGSTNHDYVNGKLDPLGSYRACVAGFTRIVFMNDSISSRESYVSFSDYSESAVLPQNPDVITGAVVGCILGAVLIAAIVIFIFWKKRRYFGKNNEVPFSPIVPKKSKLIKVENFESYFKKQKADSNCGFAEEYEDLRPVGVNQPRFAAELPENKAKNRYNNVLPYDISRVKLSVQNHPTNDYINANYMPGYNSKKEFIAAQGPLPNTVQDFWRMIWEKNIHTIVMLTKCIEQGRTKCEEYWPNKQSKNYGDITVAMTSEIILPEWTIRDFSMEKSDSSVSHPVRQFHFTSWPDHGVPETTDLLISFRHLVQDYMKQNPPTPTLVHCSAGVGRTGTFIAIDRLIHQMEMENTVDVYGFVYDLRMHRPLMVQTEEQYVFLNQCVMDIIKSKKEKKVDLIYQNTNAMAIYENIRPSPHIGKANGYHM